jgi:precorrin-2 dehydrogenase / sirohydrochlorin ferrochelatase
MSRYYPVMLRIEAEHCLVVGGGAVGVRKAKALIEAGAIVTVVSPDVSAELEALAESASISLLQEPYRAEHLQGKTLVFAATNLARVNAAITADAKSAGLLVNSADAPDTGSFIVPSVVRRGELCISISTGSASPKLAARIRRELEQRFPDSYALYIDLLSTMRSSIKELTESPELRGLALEALLQNERELRAAIDADGMQVAFAMAREIAVRAMEQ